jgi:hypothetical protein
LRGPGIVLLTGITRTVDPWKMGFPSGTIDAIEMLLADILFRMRDIGTLTE